MTAPLRIPHKRGDTWCYTLTVAIDTVTGATAPLDLTGWSIRSQGRDVEGNVVDFVVTCVNPAAGQPPNIFTHACANTTAWVPGMLAVDIEYTTPDTGNGITISSTETFSIVVIEDVTR